MPQSRAIVYGCAPTTAGRSPRPGLGATSPRGPGPRSVVWAISALLTTDGLSAEGAGEAAALRAGGPHCIIRLAEGRALSAACAGSVSDRRSGTSKEAWPCPVGRF